MKVKSREVVLDPVYMLMREPGGRYARFTEHPFYEPLLADAINARLALLDHTAGGGLESVRMIPPGENGLDRWSLLWKFYADATATHHIVPRSVTRAADLRAGLPAPVASVLRTVAGWSIDLSPPAPKDS